MSRQMLIGLVVLLAAGVGGLGYSLYQEKKQPDGVQINLGPNGVTVEGK